MNRLSLYHPISLIDHPVPTGSIASNSLSLYRALLIEADNHELVSLNAVLVRSRFLVDRCHGFAEAVKLYRDHDLVLVRANDETTVGNLRHIISWLRHDSVVGEVPFALIVAPSSILSQMEGLSCAVLDEAAVFSELPGHLNGVRWRLDAVRKQRNSSFWSRFFRKNTSAKKPVREVHPNSRPLEPARSSALPGSDRPSPAQDLDENTSPVPPMHAAEEVSSFVPPRQTSAEVLARPMAELPLNKSRPRDVKPFRRPLDVASVTPSLLETIADGVVVLNSEFKVIDANPAWLEIFDQKLDAILGSDAGEFDLGFDSVAWRNILQRALLGRDFDASSDVLEAPLGQLKVRPVRGSDATPGGILVVCSRTSLPGDKSPEEVLAEVEKVRGEMEDRLKAEHEKRDALVREMDLVKHRLAAAKSSEDAVRAELAAVKSEADELGEKHARLGDRFNELVDAIASARGLSEVNGGGVAPVFAPVDSGRMDIDLMDHAPFGVVRLSPVGEVLLANSQIDRILGFPVRRGQTFTDWIAQGRSAADTSAELVDLWTDRVWRRQLTSVMQVAGDDGLLKDVEFRPILMDDGGILVFVADVTDRQRAYDAHSSAEMKFRGIFRSSVVGIALADSDGVIFDANQTFSEMFGRTRGDVCNLQVNALLEQCRVDRSFAALGNGSLKLSLPNGERAVFAVAAGTGANDVFHVVFCQPIPDGAKSPEDGRGEIAGYEVQALLAAAEVFREAEISGDSLRKPHGEVLQRWLHVFAALMSAESVNGSRNELDLAAVTRALIHGFVAQLSPESACQVTVDAPVDEQFVDRSLGVPMALIVAELIGNALCHGMKNGHVSGVLRVHFTRKDHELIAEICNTGAGLCPGFDFEHDRKEGLSFAHLMVEKLGGKLKIEPGTETRCQVNLPLAAARVMGTA